MQDYIAKCGGRLAGPLVVCAALCAASVSLAQTGQSRPNEPGWVEEKCRRYAAAWQRVTAARGLAGISRDFQTRHATFIAGGCTGVHDVCPRSKEEFDLANILFIVSMNAGTASTFAPFGCPK